MLVGKDQIHYTTEIVKPGSLIDLFRADINEYLYDDDRLKRLKFATYTIYPDSKFEVISNSSDFDFYTKDSFLNISEIRLIYGIAKQIIIEQILNKNTNQYELEVRIIIFRTKDYS